MESVNAFTRDCSFLFRPTLSHWFVTFRDEIITRSKNLSAESSTPRSVFFCFFSRFLVVAGGQDTCYQISERICSFRTFVVVCVHQHATSIKGCCDGVCGRLACASRHRQMRIKMMPCFISSFPHRGFHAHSAAAEPHASWPTGTGSVQIILVVKSALFCWGWDATSAFIRRLQQRRLQLAAVACHTANTDGSADGWNKISAQRSSPVRDNLAFLRKLVNSPTPWQLKGPDLCLSGFMSTVAAQFLLTFFYLRDTVCLGAVTVWSYPVCLSQSFMRLPKRCRSLSERIWQ